MSGAAIECHVPFGQSTGALHLMLQRMKLLPGMACGDRPKVGVFGVGARATAAQIADETEGELHAIVGAGKDVLRIAGGLAPAEAGSFDGVLVAQAGHCLPLGEGDDAAAEVLAAARELLRGARSGREASQSRLGLLWARVEVVGGAPVSDIFERARAAGAVLPGGAYAAADVNDWHDGLKRAAAAAGLGVPMHRKLIDSVVVRSPLDAGAVLAAAADGTVLADPDTPGLAAALGDAAWSGGEEMRFELTLHSWVCQREPAARA